MNNLPVHLIFQRIIPGINKFAIISELPQFLSSGIKLHYGNAPVKMMFYSKFSYTLGIFYKFNNCNKFSLTGGQSNTRLRSRLPIYRNIINHYDNSAAFTCCIKIYTPFWVCSKKFQYNHVSQLHKYSRFRVTIRCWNIILTTNQSPAVGLWVQIHSRQRASLTSGILQTAINERLPIALLYFTISYPHRERSSSCCLCLGEIIGV